MFEDFRNKFSQSGHIYCHPGGDSVVCEDEAGGSCRITHSGEFLSLFKKLFYSIRMEDDVPCILWTWVRGAGLCTTNAAC